MKSIKKILLLVIYTAIVTTLLTEGIIRIYPKLLPPKVLLNFNEELRSDIAQRIGLQSKHDVIELTRDDGGPPLTVFKPFTRFTFDYEDAGSINSQTADEIGFCNIAGTYDKEKFDIITIGDSLTWCTTVRPEDSWTKKLSRRTGLSAYNLGRGGVGLYEYLQILKAYGLQKSPKVVIMGATESNDLRDAVRFYSFKGSQSPEKYSQWPPKRQCSNPICSLRRTMQEGPVGRHSYATNLFISSLRVIASKTIYAHQNTPDTNFKYTLSFTKHSIPFNKDNVDVDEIVHASKLLSGEISTDLYSQALSDFIALSKEHGFLPIVVYLPSAHTVYSQYVVFENEKLRKPLDEFSTKQRNFFKDKAEELKYIFIDTTEALKKESENYTTEDRLLYYPTNLHFTKYGHEVVADTIIRSLIEAQVFSL